MNAQSRTIVVAQDCPCGLLTTAQSAAYLGVTPRTLEVWRCVGRYGIPYIKVGRLVKYRKADLDAFLAARTLSGFVEGGATAIGGTR